MIRFVSSTHRLAMCAVVGSGLVFGAALAEDKSKHSGGDHAAAHQGETSTTGAASGQTLDQAMKKGMEAMQKVPMSGNVDKDFAAMMRAHHQQAVAMAEIELRDGTSPELKSMARKMMTDQKKEIDMLGQWINKQPQQ